MPTYQTTTIEYVRESGTCAMCKASDIDVAGLAHSKVRVCKECLKESLIVLTGWRLRGMFAQFEIASESGRRIRVLRRHGEI